MSDEDEHHQDHHVLNAQLGIVAHNERLCGYIYCLLHKFDEVGFFCRALRTYIGCWFSIRPPFRNYGVVCFLDGSIDLLVNRIVLNAHHVIPE